MNLKPWIYNIIPLFVWFLLLLLPFISAPVNISAADHHRFLVHILITNSLLLIIFYLHTYVLYPLKQEKFPLYLIGFAVLFLLYFSQSFLYKFGVFKSFAHVFPPANMNRQFNNGQPNNLPPMGGPGDFMFVLCFVIVILCSFCYRVIINNAAREQLLRERETTHLRTELNFLRSQINPHFLFNILNSLTSLARKKSDQLEPAIVNLSQLMRYMLYESDNNKVSLKKELAYLTSYINLQLLRFGNDVSVQTNFTGNYEDCQIDPMLLIPLVENAFKHGTDVEDHNIILINLDVPDGQMSLNFKMMNYFNSQENNAEKSTGIGLKNIQRRLDILYPGKHNLNTYSVGDLYTAELFIDFS